jgi:hypothetical protein
MFKISPGLKAAMKDEIVRTKSGFSGGDIKFLLKQVQLSVQALYLDTVASIDYAHHIEEVGEQEDHNDFARRILLLDPQQLTPAEHPKSYDNQGQTAGCAEDIWRLAVFIPQSLTAYVLDFWEKLKITWI